MPLSRCEIWVVCLITAVITSGFVLHEEPKPVVDTKTHDAVVGMWCVAWRNLVCGSDAVTYWNECLLEKSALLKPGLVIKNSGPCPEVDCDECPEPIDTSIIHVCGSNRQVFPSFCHFECYKDKYPLLEETFYTCLLGHYPTLTEMENTTIDQYNAIIDEYFLKIQSVISANSFGKIQLDDYVGAFETSGVSVGIEAKKGWLKDLSSMRKIDPLRFYGYSETTATVKVTFALDTLEAGYLKLSIKEDKNKIKGMLALKIIKNTVEMIGEITPGNLDCPLVKVSSLRLTEISDLILELSTPVNFNTSNVTFDGIVKEKILEVINNALERVVLPKIKEIGCIYPITNTTACYGIFHRRVCF